MIRRRPRPRPNPHAAEVAALVARVHHPPRACRSCGAGTGAAPPVDGWPTCSRCAAAATACGDLALGAAALLLDIDPAGLPGLAVGRLHGPLYADSPGADPARPRERWGHVDALTRADVLDRLRSLVDADRRHATGGPCTRCGAQWSTRWDDGPEGRPLCAVCATDGPRGPRSADAVAADLIGLQPYLGCAEEMGFRWWADTHGAGPGDPWAHLDLDRLRTAAAHRYRLPGEWVSPAAARAAGVTQPEPTTVAWKVTADDGLLRPDGAGGVRGGKVRTLAPVAPRRRRC